ncbi:hypothetical protein [Solirubrobacter soli]|uniref:hypothetical protein n=1 Tax=Solirubrobacter soli TaxID=363832 RepID=UPI000488232E|nr:hypothetical protein [Solirubrobacter soli]
MGEVTALDLSSLAPTDPVLNSRDPTLSRGNESAAYPVPPNATKTAMVAITLAYDTRARSRLAMRRSMTDGITLGHLLR